MKKDFHPKYHSNAKITCACGNVIKVGSTIKETETEICNACHPFYTGKKKLVDSTGRVDRFKKRMAISSKIKKVSGDKKEKEEKRLTKKQKKQKK